MKESWTLIDCNFLMHRAFYAHGKLSFDGEPTGALFGFFRDVLMLQERFGPNVGFCFDHGRGLRYDVLPTYKSARKNKTRTEDERRGLAELRQQITLLKFEYLQDLGFCNIWFASGYEADDIIAAQCLTMRTNIIIVSSDQDLFQCLRSEPHEIRIWQPTRNEFYTEAKLYSDYLIEPQRWHCCKAIAGCGTDDVPGIDGVGEKTAAKFLNSSLSKGSVAYDKIVAGEAVWKRNLKLVKLPYPGCPTFACKPDETDSGKWQRVLKKLGMKSLQGMLPGKAGVVKGFGLGVAKD